MKKTLRKNGMKVLATMMCLAIPFSGVATMANAAGVKALDYSTDLTSAETLDLANEMNVSICEEGFILLKNDAIDDAGTKALPVAPRVQTGGGWRPTYKNTKVSVFGRNSTNQRLAYGGGGSSSAGAYSNPTDLVESLTMAGYEVNPTLEAFYEAGDKDGSAPAGPGREVKTSVGKMSNYRTGETPIANYTQEVKDSIANYNDMALVVISRSSGEGGDAELYSKENTGRTDLTEHYLELDQNEKELLKFVKEQGFGRVVAIINATSMEMGFIEEEEYGIDAAIHIGAGPGRTGVEALGSILSGAVNPSGRSVDTFYRDFTKDPTYFDFGNVSQGNNTGLNLGYESGDEYYVNGKKQNNSRFINYQEGIYMGYRYYETRGYEEQQKVLKTNPQADETAQFAWYDNAMVYPFGYGLSYTTFEWTIADAQPAAGSTLTAEGNITVNVKVKNTGAVAGKDVVELYYTAPYTAGGIEKAHVVLGGFAKTDLLQPGAEQTVSITMRVRDMASYDWNDANDNTFKGYEMDPGTYTIRLGKNANEAWRSSKLQIEYTVGGNGFQYRMNHAGDYEVVNRFDEASEGVLGDFGKYDHFTREDFEGSFTHFLKPEERTVTEDFIATLTRSAERMIVDEKYDEGKPWYAETAPTQSETPKTGNEENLILLSDLVGLEREDPLWDKFMDQLTTEQLNRLVDTGMFHTYAIPELGVPSIDISDGPLGFTQGASTGCYASTCVLAATWNLELAEEMGKTIGLEGLSNGFNAIYAPGSNVHRSPFCGRNFEYYSEDGFLSGKMGAAETIGIQSQGVGVFVKHFALRGTEVETNKTSLWITEQAMRELYLPSFQIPVEEGNALGVMICTNAIGSTFWAGDSYELITEVLKNEWGFKGVVHTDWGTGLCNEPIESRYIRAGVDFVLADGHTNLLNKEYNWTYSGGSKTINLDTPTQRANMRRAAESVLYFVSRTNAMPNFHAQNEIVTRSNKVDIDASSYTTIKSSRGVVTRTYSVTGDLPASFAIDSETGRITGDATKAEAGKYEFTVNHAINGKIFSREKMTVVIPGLKYEAGTLAQGSMNAPYVGTVATAESIYAGGVNYTLKEGKLPAGVILDSNGTLVGTPTEKGTFNFTVIATTAYAQEEEASFSLVIGDAAAGGTTEWQAPYIGENGHWFVDGKDSGVSATGPAGQDGKPGADGENGKGGCGSVIGVGGAIVASLTVLGAAAIVTRKKKD